MRLAPTHLRDERYPDGTANNGRVLVVHGDGSAACADLPSLMTSGGINGDFVSR
jgi:hypothetical protein